MNDYKDIYEQFVDEASFLWVLRSIAVEQPHYNVVTLRELEQRIDAQLDGLMTSIEDAWQICLEALKLAEPGEVFTSTVIAFRSHDITKIQKAVEVGLSNDEATKGLISALGWLPGRLVHPWMSKFFSSKDLDHKYLALAACSVRRENPGEHLNKILDRKDCKEHEKLYSRALRLIGELRRQDLMPSLEKTVNSDNQTIQFWSNWSAVLLGNRSAVNNLSPFVFESGLYQVRAIDIAFRALPIEVGRRWISKLGGDESQMRSVIKATGILGDPHAVNWLINNMHDARVAKLSGEAFTLITGIDLAGHSLTLDSLPETPIHPDNGVDNEDVSLDEDENLPWPDAQEVSIAWMNVGKNYVSGQRYFLGLNINASALKNHFSSSNQRHRKAASLELALMDESIPLLNYKAKL